MTGIKKEFFFAFILLVFISTLPASALAVFPGKTYEYEGGGEGKVVFNGSLHRGQHKGCADCHPDIFPMKAGVKITMADIYAKKFCGACHNGTVAFDAKDPKNCGRCHKK